MTKSELVNYVLTLKLTKKQKAFAQAYVLAPDDATAAAMKADSKIKPRAAAASASRWLKNPRIQAYLDVLRNTPSKAMTTEVLQPITSTARVLERGLEILRQQAEGQIPTGTKRRSGTTDGKAFSWREREFDRLGAAKEIVDHYAPKAEAQVGSRTMIFNLLDKVPTEVLSAQVDAMMRGGRVRPQRDDD